MMFKEVLIQIAQDLEIELDDLCFLVSTDSFDFPFSFFAFEDEEVLGILVTDENGAEKLHVIIKSTIVYFRIHYLDELMELFDDDYVERSRRINIHE